MGLAISNVKTIQKSFEEKCVTLLVSAYHLSIENHSYSTDWMENDYTSMLDEYIDKDPQRKEWQYSCNIEHHIHKPSTSKSKGYANSEDRIDMRITTFSSSIEYHFFVEAKRLKENDSWLLNRYINTGIDHYLSRKYPQGILLGYLVEGDVDNTIQKVNGILVKNNRDSEILVRIPHNIHNQYFESTHPNFGVISHFVFDFTV